MRKGERVAGEKRIENHSRKLNYHAADRRGRIYLCGCYRCLRLQERILYPRTAKGRFAYKLKPRNK